MHLCERTKYHQKNRRNKDYVTSLMATTFKQEMNLLIIDIIQCYKNGYLRKCLLESVIKLKFPSREKKILLIIF